VQVSASSQQRRLRQVVIMARVITVNDVLDGHVVLDIECLDRIYLNAYVPIRQSSGQAERTHGPSDYIYELLQVVSAGYYPFAVDTPT
jgi:hypothetical protein